MERTNRIKKVEIRFTEREYEGIKEYQEMRGYKNVQEVLRHIIRQKLIN